MDCTPTPLLCSTVLSKRLGKPVFLKMDNMRPSGSFKDRGIGALLSSFHEEGINEVVSSSGGNAGVATAYCGRILGMKVTVVVPESTSTEMIARIRDEKAEVIIFGVNWNDADERARKIIDSAQYKIGYVHPFDHPVIWTGHSSMIHEAKLQLNGKVPGCVVCCVGGGGLLCGVLEGMNSVGWENVPVIACETEGAASFNASFEAKKFVSIAAITTIATTLGAKMVCEQSLNLAMSHKGGVHSHVITDAVAVNAVVNFANHHRTLVEPSCGTALSVIYEMHELISQVDSVLIIVCGGNGITLPTLESWKQRFSMS